MSIPRQFSPCHKSLLRLLNLGHAGFEFKSTGRQMAEAAQAGDGFSSFNQSHLKTVLCCEHIAQANLEDNYAFLMELSSPMGSESFLLFFCHLTAHRLLNR